jgi:hypothetical protein
MYRYSITRLLQKTMLTNNPQNINLKVTEIIN